jgi:hypothetical protein
LKLNLPTTLKVKGVSRMRRLIFILLLVTGLLLPRGQYLLAADESINYPDEAGREAFRLWAERENDRAVAEAVRRYWDYWYSRSSPKYSSQRSWFELEETQKWLKDPKHHKPPPPPPGYWIPPAYPYYPYYYSPYPWTPQLWYPPPYYYPYPKGQKNHKD